MVLDPGGGAPTSSTPWVDWRNPQIPLDQMPLSLLPPTPPAMPPTPAQDWEAFRAAAEAAREEQLARLQNFTPVEDKVTKPNAFRFYGDYQIAHQQGNQLPRANDYVSNGYTQYKNDLNDKPSVRDYILARWDDEAKAASGESTSAGVTWGAQGGGDIVNYARKYLGQSRYVYGGFDCSKFVQTVAAGLGMSIPRATGGQVPWFKQHRAWTTDLRKAVPGDLIFYHGAGDDHVGVYIGNGKMIDNTRSGVKVRPIWGSGFWGIGKLTNFYTPGTNPRAIDIGDPGSPLGIRDYGAVTSGMKEQKGAAPYGLQKRFWQGLVKANKEMKELGLGAFLINSGYRSFEEQARYYANPPQGRHFNPPGNSVHGLGLAADLQLTDSQFKWLKKHGGKYGLVNLPSEKWHWQLHPGDWEEASNAAAR